MDEKKSKKSKKSKDKEKEKEKKKSSSSNSSSSHHHHHSDSENEKGNQHHVITSSITALLLKAQHNALFRQKLQLYGLVAVSVLIMLLFIFKGEPSSSSSSFSSSSNHMKKNVTTSIHLRHNNNNNNNDNNDNNNHRRNRNDDENNEEGDDGGEVIGVDGDDVVVMTFGRPKREVEIENSDDLKITGSDLKSVRRRFGTREENEKAQQQSSKIKLNPKDELCFKFPAQIKRTPGEPFTYYMPKKVFDLPVLQRQLKRLGWEQETNLKKATLALKGVPRITFRQLREGKMYYDMVASLGRIGSKKKTQLATLRAHVRKFGCSFESLHIQPRSWDMNRPSECKNFFETNSADRGRMIVFKSCNAGEGSKGAGIIVSDNLKEYREKYSGCNQNEFNYVAQYYIEHPLLVDNKKFDMRCYLFVASTKPYIVFFNPGYIRRSLAEYKPTSTDKNDVLTNYHVQMTRADFSPADAMWPFSKLIEYLQGKGLCKACGDIEIRLAKIARLVFDSGRQYYVRHPGSFQIVGLDFMMDANLRPMFIEGNVSPGLGSHELKWKKDLMDDLITLMYQKTTQIAERPEEFTMLIGDRVYGPRNNYWELIVHEQHEQCDKKYALNPCTDLKPDPKGW